MSEQPPSKRAPLSSSVLPSVSSSSASSAPESASAYAIEAAKTVDTVETTARETTKEWQELMTSLHAVLDQSHVDVDDVKALLQR